MALAFWVDSGPECIASAFAAHDEYLAIFSFFAGGRSKRMLTPDDEFYTAPFCFMPKGRNNGFIVFTAQVPWLHGSPSSQSDENVQRQSSRDEGPPTTTGTPSAHRRAREWQERKGAHDPPHLGTVEQFQRILGLGEADVKTFTRGGHYPCRDEISQDLEEKAVEETCLAMKWSFPLDFDWRERRKKERNLHGMPLLDLADWDAQRAAKRGGKGCVEHNSIDTHEGADGDGGNVNPDGAEEKKAEEYQC